MKSVKFSITSSSRSWSHSPPEHGLQRTRALFLLAELTAFPFGEVLPTGGDPAEPALGAVGDDNQGIVPEQVGNGVPCNRGDCRCRRSKRVRQSV